MINVCMAALHVGSKHLLVQCIFPLEGSFAAAHACPFHPLRVDLLRGICCSPLPSRLCRQKRKRCKDSSSPLSRGEEILTKITCRSKHRSQSSPGDTFDGAASAGKAQIISVVPRERAKVAGKADLGFTALNLAAWYNH